MESDPLPKPFVYRTLTDDVLNNINTSVVNSQCYQDELLRNYKVDKEDVQSLQEWCKKSHLPNFSGSDLVLFLYLNDYDLQMTKTYIDSFHSMRKSLPKFFKERDPYLAEVREALDVVCAIPLKHMTKKKCTVIVSKLLVTEPERYDYDKQIKIFNMVLDICVLDMGTKNNYIFVFDLKEMTWNHYLRINSESVRKFMHYLQFGCPARWECLYYVNAGAAISSFRETVKKAIINRKYATKIYFYPSVIELNDVVPIRMLPTEMCGKAGQVMELHSYQVRQLERRTDWLSRELCAGQPKIKANDTIDFRNLQID